MQKTMEFTLVILTFLAILSMPQAHARSVKVMSYNILNQYFSDTLGHGSLWSLGKSLVLELITEADPDTIGFQEGAVQQSLDLDARLANYSVVRFPVETLVPDKAHRALSFKSDKSTLLNDGFFQPLDGGQRNAT